MKPYNRPSFNFTLLIAFAIGLLIVSAAGYPVIAQAKPTKFQSDGDFADLFHFDNATNTYSFLGVSRYGTKQEPQTFLYFNTQRVDLATNSIIYVYGSGSIPNADFDASSGQSLNNYSLRTDTTNNPDFFTEMVVCNLQTFVCSSSLTSGVVTADFQKTKSISERSHGSYEAEYPNPDGSTVKVHLVGSWTRASATAQASILGIAFNNVNGSVGSNHGVDMIIEKAAH
ncbi:MAG: hypothetical protein MOB07_26350 [Acidobacteria bacterium]|nr:hypothetical protein [Acidobacteriota bacterium]